MNKSGVYKIVHSQSGGHYIGSAIDILQRLRTHRYHLNRRTHHSIKLQRAWNKYGAENFVFEILLHCDPKNCLMYEQIALDYYKPEYNICKVAGSNLGTKRSQQTIDKLRQAKLGMKNPRYGKPGTRIGYKLDKTAREKLSIAHIGIQTGENNPASKLTVEQVRSIRQMLNNGYSCASLGKLFNVAARTISRIKHRKIWKSI